MNAKDDEFILLSDLELPASEAVQFAVSLWAEGLLIPQENNWTNYCTNMPISLYGEQFDIFFCFQHGDRRRIQS